MNALSEFMVDDLLFYLTDALERAEDEDDWPSRAGLLEGVIEHAIIRLGGIKRLQQWREADRLPFINDLGERA